MSEDLTARVALLEARLMVLESKVGASQPEALLTGEEAAEYLCTTPKHIQNLVYRRKLRKCKGTRKLIFTKSALDAYLHGK